MGFGQKVFSANANTKEGALLVMLKSLDPSRKLLLSGCGQMATKRHFQQPEWDCIRKDTLGLLPQLSKWSEEWTRSTPGGKSSMKQVLLCTNLSLLWNGPRPLTSFAHLNGPSASGLRPPWGHSKQAICPGCQWSYLHIAVSHAHTNTHNTWSYESIKRVGSCYNDKLFQIKTVASFVICCQNTTGSSLKSLYNRYKDTIEEGGGRTAQVITPFLLGTNCQIAMLALIIQQESRVTWQSESAILSASLMIL